MKITTFSSQGNTLTRTSQDARIVAGSIGTNAVQFDLTHPLWAGLTATAVFKAGTSECSVAVLDKTAAYEIPAQMMANAGLPLWVGIFGIDGDGAVVVPTTYAKVCDAILVGTNTTAEESTVPEESIYAQWVSDISDAASNAQSSAEDAAQSLAQTNALLAEAAIAFDEATDSALATINATSEAQVEILQEVASKAPILSDENNWLVWDTTADAYADTGVPATGDQGVQGEKGDTGAAFTYTDFTAAQLAALKGEQGEKGDTGAAFTYADFTTAQLAALKGETGEKGEQGETGETGAQGAAFTYADFTAEQLAALKGEQGEQGETGEQGEQGKQGETGETGAQGPAGQDAYGFSILDSYDTLADLYAAHPTAQSGDAYFVHADGENLVYLWVADSAQYLCLGGLQGPQGEQGDAFTYADFTAEQLATLKGEKGDTGATGATGAQGAAFTYADFTTAQLAALKGEQGEQGEKGEKGDTGATGATGAQGAAFTYTDFTTAQLAALKGEQGEKGEKGDTGATGAVGATGATGAQGAAFTYADFTTAQLAALKGEQGEQGEKGDTGATGAVGATGATGAQGAAFTYADFTTAQLTALKGEQGEQGETGAQGTPTVVNGLTGESITLDGADIALAGYATATATSAIAQTDTVNSAVAKLEKANLDLLTGQSTAALAQSATNGIATYTHTYTSSTHTLTGSGTNGKFKATTSATATAITINGTAHSIVCGTAAKVVLKTGVWYEFSVDGTTLFFPEQTQYELLWTNTVASFAAQTTTIAALANYDAILITYNVYSDTYTARATVLKGEYARLSGGVYNSNGNYYLPDRGVLFSGTTLTWTTGRYVAFNITSGACNGSSSVATVAVPKKVYGIANAHLI